MFILGGIIFSSVTLAATKISADKIEYSANVTVKDKIDNLYTKVKPNYTGDTTVNPVTGNNPLVLATAGKVLNSDITINPIPSSFTDISLSTITNTNDIVSGKKAYKADGTLITGTKSCLTDKKMRFSIWLQSFASNFDNRSLGMFDFAEYKNQYKYITLITLDQNANCRGYSYSLFDSTWNNRLLNFSLNTKYLLSEHSMFFHYAYSSGSSSECLINTIFELSND
jgi:hypothetical protein